MNPCGTRQALPIMRREENSRGNAPNPVPGGPLPHPWPPPPWVPRRGPSRRGQAALARSRPRRSSHAPSQPAHGSRRRRLAQRHEHDDDLYPRPQPSTGRRYQSGLRKPGQGTKYASQPCSSLRLRPPVVPSCETSACSVPHCSGELQVRSLRTEPRSNQ